MIMASVGPVIARMRANAPRETVWEYFANAEMRRGWWPDIELECALGSEVSERWSDGDGPDAARRDAKGAVDVLIAGHALGFRWRDAADAHDTEVLITLRSHDTETGVTITETGFGRFPDAFERSADAQQGWIELLTELVAVLAQIEPAPAPASPAAVPAAAESEQAAPSADEELLETEVPAAEAPDGEALGTPETTEGAGSPAATDVPQDVEAGPEAELEPAEHLATEYAEGDELPEESAAAADLGEAREAEHAAEGDLALDPDPEPALEPTPEPAPEITPEPTPEPGFDSILHGGLVIEAEPASADNTTKSPRQARADKRRKKRRA